jgi:arylsulfatase A-like enzyme
MSQKPNILLIILDTLRRDHLSSYGYTRDTSPYLDEFSTHATIFNRAIAPAQWTIPSHASLFTGLYPSTHQVTQASDKLSGSYPTLAEILQVDGYHTVGFSNNPLVGVLDNDLTRGFGEFYNYSGAAPNRPIDQKRSRVRRTMATQFRRVAGQVSNLVAQHDELFRMSLNPTFFPALSRFVNYKGDTERSVDDLWDYWTDHHAGGSDKPMFAFLNLMGAHTPYRPPQDSLKHIAPDLSNDRHAFGFISNFNSDPARWASPIDKPLEDWQSYAIDAFYDAEIAHQDKYIGRLLKSLKQAGYLDNTLVMIAADHGEGHGDHRFFGHGFVVYQELVHVPLIIHYPERFPAKRVTTNVSTRRIFHTALDIAGVKPPLASDDPNADVENLSLIRATNGRPDSEGGIVYSEAVPPKTFLHVLEHRTPHHIDELQLTQTRRGIYEGDHKLAVVGESIEGLFELTADPSEAHDITTNQHELADTLQAKVSEFVTQTTNQRADPMHKGQVSDDVIDNLRQLGYFE